MFSIASCPSFFPCFNSEFSAQLEEFEGTLKDRLYAQFSKPEETALIESRWVDIRDQACRNAGLGYWGEHVLGHQESLQAEMGTVIEAIDSVGYRPWPREDHENLMSQLLEHIFYPCPSLPELTWDEIKMLFVDKNQELWDQAREQVEEVFPRLLEQMETEDHPDKMTEALVGHVIGLYTYLAPKDGAEVQLLQKIDGKWQLVNYRIEKIQLTDPTLTSSAYAYGLTPLENDKANPVLIYQGTAGPADPGALIGYMADLTPFHSVGELIYTQAREAIREFVNRTDKQVNVYGLSLGGALSILTGEDLPDKTIVHAHAAPGKLPWSLVPVNGENIYHENDLVVPTLGFFHPNLRLYRTLTGEDPAMARNFLKAHALPPAGCVPTIILKINTQYENERLFRKVWTVFQQAMSIVLFTVMAVYILAKYAFNQITGMIAARLCPADQKLPQEIV